MVDPIAAIAATPLTPATPPTGVGRAAPVDDVDSNFATLLNDGLQSVSDAERTADAVAQDMATGGESRIEDLMVATSEAQLGIQMLSVVRDKAIAAYQEIMRMPV